MMRLRRIIANILLICMIATSVMSNDVVAYAAQDSGSVQEVATEAETTVVDESEEAASESEENITEVETISTEEAVTEAETTTEEELTTEESTTEDSTALVPGLTLQGELKWATGAEAKGAYIELFNEAAKAFKDIVATKDIYALIYLTDEYQVRENPSADAPVVATLESAHTVRIVDIGVDMDSITDEDYMDTCPTVWYKIRFYVGDEEMEGYALRSNLAYSDDLLLAWEEKYADLLVASDMESVGASDIEQFPASYQSSLQSLKNAHSKWTFVPMKVSSTFESNVKKQSGWSGGQPYSMVSASAKAEFKDKDMGNGWYSATEAAVRYYMDPKNWLDEKSVFMFEQESFNSSYHSVDALQKFLNGTYFSDQAGTIFDVGKNQSISPFYLAARIISEQGKDGSQMVFGRYPGYEGYYNHFNIGATGTGETALKNGLTYARNHGWNTPAKSIEGGASTLGNNYIKRGQDTIYLQKFDLVTGNMHQYMQALHAPYNDASSMYNLYNNTSSLGSAFVFKIPVYSDQWGDRYELNMSSATIKKGATTKLIVKKNGNAISLTDKAIKGIKLNHSAQKYKDKSVIAFNTTSGVITANTAGKTEIIVTVHDSNANKDITLKCYITVLSPVTGATIDKKELQLYAAGATEPTAENYVKYPADFSPTFTSVGTLQLDIEAIRDAYLKDKTKEKFPYDTTDSYTVSWTIDDKSVATLSEVKNYTNATASASPHTYSTVKVTAKGGGWATVTATVTVAKSKFAAARTYKQTCKIYVRKPMMTARLDSATPPASAADPISVALKTGQKEKMSLIFTPLDTTDNINITWKVPDAATDIVEVVDDYIIAKGTGSCTLDAIVGPFYYNTAKTKYGQFVCKVNVTVTSLHATFMDGEAQFTRDEIVYGKTLGDATYTSSPWNKGSDDPSKMFMGWYTAAGGNGKQITKDTVVSGDIIAYAYYEPVDSELHAKPLGSYEYNGNRIYPEVEAFYGSTPLVRGVDYTLTYENNVDAADYMALVHPVAHLVGKGAYAGKTLDMPFSITPKSLADSDIVAEDYYAPYNGREHKYAPVIKWGDRTLKNKRDYTFAFNDVRNGAYKEQGSYTITITAAPGSNYTGTIKSYIYITKNTLVENLTVTYGDAKTGFNGFHKEKYTGSAIKPKLTVKNGKETLTIVTRAKYDSYKTAAEREAVDCIFDYANNIEIGTADIIITGVNRFLGTRTMHFKIVGTSMAKIAVSGIKTVYYDGAPVYQKSDGGKVYYKLTLDKTVLKEGTDYTVEYSGNDKVGVGKITFVGKGKYSGYTTRNFLILPKISGSSMSPVSDSDDQDMTDGKSDAAKSVEAKIADSTKPVATTDKKLSTANTKNSDTGKTSSEGKPSIVLSAKEDKEAAEYVDSTGRDVTGIMVYSLEALK